ncbi:hypothetical protein PQX77_005458, partial [Marasmius sp. AFHP31]
MSLKEYGLPIVDTHETATLATEFQVDPDDRVFDRKEDVELRLTTTVNTPLHRLPLHERYGASLDVKRFLKPDPNQPTVRLCVLCILAKDEGASEKVQAYTPAAV